MVLASSLTDTLGLVVVFFVAFPAIITGIIVFAVVQAFGEKRADNEYRGHRAERP